MKLNNNKNNHASGSLKVVLTALVVNAVITIAKTAVIVTGLQGSIPRRSLKFIEVWQDNSFFMKIYKCIIKAQF